MHRKQVVPENLSRLIVALLVLATACTSTEAPVELAQSAQLLFSNGSFENGNLSGWTSSTNLNPGITIPPTSVADLNLQTGGTGFTFARQAAAGPETQIPAGLDATASLRWPKYGNWAAVVNENGKNRNVNRLVQSAPIGPGDVDPADGKVHVRFALAPVLENPNHTASQQPYIYIVLRNTTRGTVLWSTFNFANQAGVPWKTFGAIQYTDWQSVDVAPGDARLSVGDTVELEVIAAGCSQGGHWGHVYVDGFGAFLPGLSIAATAPQSANDNTDLTYTYLAKNSGATATPNTQVTIVLPEHTSYVSFANASCVRATTNGVDTLTCSLGTLNPTASTQFQVTVHIDQGATGVISHGNYSIQATSVSPLIGPLVETTLTSGVAYADLAVSLTDGVVAVGWGDPIHYTLTVTNHGPAGANGASIDDDFPAQLTGISWTCSGSGGATCATSSGSGNIHVLGDLPPGGHLTFAVDATVIAGSGSGSLNDRASVTAPSSSQDSDSTNNVAVDIDGIGTLYPLTVAKDPAGDGAGSIISSPAAISCDAACASANARFLDGSQVSLTATAAPGSTFAGWSGACASSPNPCVIDVVAATSVTALFTLNAYPITSTTQGEGTVSCPSTVDRGQSATCTLSPAPGYGLASLTDNGVEVAGSVSGGTYGIASVTQGHALVATFKKVPGISCGGNTECLGNVCADGVCCTSSCDGQCEACNVAGSVGTCSAVTGAPKGDRPACGSDGSSCGGTCDGSLREACSYPSVTTQCGSAGCSDGVATPVGTCNGAGSCGAEPLACGPYACGETACLTSCSSNSECSEGTVCMSGECKLSAARSQWMVEGSGCSSTGSGGPLAWSLVLGVFAVLARRRRAAGAALSAAAVLAVPTAALAQDDVSRSFQVERFQPQPGQADVLGVQSARTGENLSFSARVFASYAHQPLRLVSTEDESFRRLMVSSQSQFTLAASLAFQDRFEVGLTVPVLLHQATEGAGIVDPRLQGGISSTALEDLHLSAKASLLREEDYGLAVSLPITLPTAPGDSYVGGSGFTFNPTVIAELAGPRNSSLMLNAGVLLGRSRQFLNLDLGPALTYGVGGKVDLVPRWNLSFLTTLAGEVGLSHPTAETSPLELLLGLRWGFMRNLEATVGAGPGLTNGFGTPRYRLLAALSYVPGSRPVTPAPTPIAAAPLPPPAPVPEPLPAPVEPEVVPTPAPVEPAPAPAPLPEPPAPPPAAPVFVDKGKIRALEKVNFATNKDNALPESLHILDDVFKIMSSDSSIHRLRIEAHTDNRGNTAYNQQLSERRAKWVREYLVQKGIAASRLDSSGFGPSRPIETNDTVEGRASNRRVEFVIVE